jgi:hypothetical protein
MLIHLGFSASAINTIHGLGVIGHPIEYFGQLPDSPAFLHLQPLSLIVDIQNILLFQSYLPLLSFPYLLLVSLSQHRLLVTYSLVIPIVLLH